MSKVFNISVVGGAGHIGLPLSCFLQNHGHKVTVIDKNQKVMNDASNGIEPFEEIDFKDNLNEALKNGLNFSNDMSVVAQTDYVFITLGIIIFIFKVNLSAYYWLGTNRRYALRKF